jgi:tetratricopeptide (TPR) repeat protein
VLAALREAEATVDDDEMTWRHLAGAHLNGFFFNCPGGYSAEQALRFAQRAIEADPWNPGAGVMLETVLFRNGEHEQALEILEPLLRSNGEGSTNLFVLAMSAWKLGREGDARAYYRRGVEFLERNGIVTPPSVLYRAEAARMLGLDP